MALDDDSGMTSADDPDFGACAILANNQLSDYRLDGISLLHKAALFSAPTGREPALRQQCTSRCFYCFCSLAQRAMCSQGGGMFFHKGACNASANSPDVPYSVFVWAYMDKKSKLPFNLPVYGFKVIRELFKVFDYRSQWWVNKRTMSILRYEKVQQCVQKLEAQYDIQNGVESYETIAEIAAANLLLEIFVDTVNFNKQKHEDIRLPFLQSVPSTTQFFVALASELCARTDGTTARLLNSDYGAKTAEQRFTILAKHMPRFTKHFGCTPKQRMHLARNYQDCLFWRR
nr:uncharacterized protein LOC126540319 isoform X1 [Dermacentor andersoni]